MLNWWICSKKNNTEINVYSLIPRWLNGRLEMQTTVKPQGCKDNINHLRALHTVSSVLQCAWDELDAWHSRLMLLENQVHDLAEGQPDQAHHLMDQLTQPLQLYQNASQMAEHRTSFLSKVRHSMLGDIYTVLYFIECSDMRSHTPLNRNQALT